MRGIVTASLVFAVTALAGCSEEPKPRFEEPTETPSATESTSSAAAEPKPWEKKSTVGAEAFVSRWLQAFNEAQATGEPGPLRALSADSCRTCRAFAGQIARVTAAGGSFDGKGWRALDADANPLDGDETSVAMNVLRSSQRVKSSSDSRLETYPATKGIYRADLIWVQGSWQMSELVNLS